MFFFQKCKFVPDYTISCPKNSNIHTHQCENLKSHTMGKADIESFQNNNEWKRFKCLKKNKDKTGYVDVQL